MNQFASTLPQRWCGRAILLGTLISLAVVESALGQDPETVARGRSLYQSAAYTEAIDTLAGRTEPEALQYRALSLLALRRTAEAQEAVDLLVRTSPSFVPPLDDVPPRFLALFQESRSRALPEAIRGLLADGRRKFQDKSYDAAQQDFASALRLADDPAGAAIAGMADLRTLASSYLELVTETAAAKAAPPVTAAAVSAAAPAAAAATIGVAAAAPLPPAAAAVSPAAPAAPAPVAGAAIVSPRAIRQQIPPWPALAGSREGAAAGAVRVTIGTDGRVKKAAIERRLHPLYDLQLLTAAQSWLYEPAMLNGQPVEVDKIIEIAP